MLQVSSIRNNFEKALEGLNKRNIPQADTLLSQVLEIDDKRKETQAERDRLQAESNLISKEIGTLIRAGKKEDADKVKARTAELKNQVKKLENDYDQLEETLKQ